MKHSPGSWIQTGTTIWADGHGIVCELSEVNPPSGNIEHWRLEIDSPNWDEAMANGRLIIAAPGLLTATCETIEFLNILLSYVQHMSLLYIPIQARRDELQRIVDEVSSGE